MIVSFMKLRASSLFTNPIELNTDLQVVLRYLTRSGLMEECAPLLQVLKRVLDLFTKLLSLVFYLKETMEQLFLLDEGSEHLKQCLI